MQSILQAQDVMVPVANGSYFGDGSATNVNVDVDADQRATNRNYQYNGDTLGIFLGSFGAATRNPATSFTPSHLHPYGELT